MSYLPAVEVNPPKEANAAVIWLHGLGANGHDFEAIVPELKLHPRLQIRFVFPHAPSIPVTVNSGFIMPAWYDILAFSEKREINIDQFNESVAETRKLIDREIERGIPSDRIVLAGFSQGGAVAYATALSEERQLAGLMALSTYIANPATLTVNPVNKNIPMHLFHGTYDSMVTPSMLEDARTILKDLGFEAPCKTYPMDHEVCMAEINDIAKWLEEVL